MDVILASHAHHVPQVGFPHIDPVTKAIILNTNQLTDFKIWWWKKFNFMYHKPFLKK